VTNREGRKRKTRSQEGKRGEKKGGEERNEPLFFLNPSSPSIPESLEKEKKGIEGGEGRRYEAARVPYN